MDKHIQELLNGEAASIEYVHAASPEDLSNDWYENRYLACVEASLPDNAALTDYQLKYISGDAHVDFLKDGCAVCALPDDPVADTSEDLRFAADRMLVRGINRFIVPSRFREDHSKLTAYLQRMAYLFEGGKSVPQAALLHCDEALQAGFAGDPSETVRQLTASQIDYDIVSSDLFAERRVDLIYNRLVINGNRYQALIVPDYACITAPLLGFILAAEETGFPVIFTGQRPSGIVGMDVSDAALALLADTGTLVEPFAAAAELISRGIQGIRISPASASIVSYHYRRENHMYLFLNESADQDYEGQIYMPGYQEPVIYDAENNTVRPLSYERTEKGILANVQIAPRQLLVIVFG
ncbi:MAG: hypothetical protein IJK56_10245 [Firmicutes bacterium]|nr:hypothetical protein [Bacillota bacterium]